mmetsp:Transcript_16129/g.52554  ORF Transcript_16129/g.52554 Transcript_16129/m.52554 type:complete len:207 (-) Transcript_16129:606-1226(-)
MCPPAPAPAVARPGAPCGPVGSVARRPSPSPPPSPPWRPRTTRPPHPPGRPEPGSRGDGLQTRAPCLRRCTGPKGWGPSRHALGLAQRGRAGARAVAAGRPPPRGRTRGWRLRRRSQPGTAGERTLSANGGDGRRRRRCGRGRRCRFRRWRLRRRGRGGRVRVRRWTGMRGSVACPFRLDGRVGVRGRRASGGRRRARRRGRGALG